MALSGLVACDASPATNRRVRYALRTHAVGCWAFTDVPRTRVVYRLDGAGRPLHRDTEGLGLSDEWTANCLSDRIQIRFSSGLSGSTWALQLPSGIGRVDTIRGRCCRGAPHSGRHRRHRLEIRNPEAAQVAAQARTSGEQLRAAAVTEGMLSLRDDGLRLVRIGATSLKEVLRVAAS